MTQRLYYTDSYRIQFDATVRLVTELDGRPAIVLDETCFYPTSGGQPFDKGTLAGLTVVDVIAADGEIFHIIDQPADAALMEQLIEQSVEGQIDWARRYDHMQQHSGQHLISQVFDTLFGYETLSVHFGDTESTLDLDTDEIADNELAQAERLANEQVMRSLPIKTYFVSEESIGSVPLRKPPAVSGQIRIVEIADTDWSACGGTHTRTTAEIGPVKFIRQQRMRGHSRISFLCGFRALNDYAYKHELISEAAALYDNEINQVPVLIRRDLDRLKELEREVENLQEEHLAYVARELAENADTGEEYRVVSQSFADLDANALKTLANHLVQEAGTVAILGSTQGGKATVIVGRADDVSLHAGNLLRTTLAEFGGGGGGRPDFAQGGGLPPERMDDALAFAITQVRSELTAATGKTDPS